MYSERYVYVFVVVAVYSFQSQGFKTCAKTH